MQLRKYGRKVAVVDYNDYSENERVSYCRKCLEYGFRVKLKNRIYPKGQPIPPDNENWLQCHSCGEVYPIYEKKNEAMIKDFVETVDNPFDSGNMFLGIDSRTSIGGKNARKKRERQKQLDEIKETDLKAELAKGNMLISYSEEMPQ